MNARRIHLALVAAAVLAPAVMADEYTVSEAERKKIEQKLAGTYNPLSFYDGKVVLDAQERIRAEYRANNVRFNDDIDDDTDTFFLQRARIGLSLKPVPYFKAYTQVQDSREIDSTRVSPIGNANLEEAEFDVRQANIEIADYSKQPLGLKVGRQELIYGDERLVGAFDWNNVARVFDAAKLRWQKNKDSVDLFFANVVLNNIFSERDGSLDDKADSADDLYGIYGQSTFLKFQTTEGYVLYRDKNDAEFDGPAREIWTVGTRMKSTPRLAPWDYYAEFAYQDGEIESPGQAANRRFGDNATNTVVDHAAFAALLGVGYSCVDSPWQPRFGLEYNYATGDEDPTDKENETFDNLLPTNHKFFGYMDLFAWKNIHNPRFMVTAQPTTALKLQLDVHSFWLAEDKDFWYRANQAPAAPGRRNAKGLADPYVGSEIDLTFWYTLNKRVSFHGGLGYFFAGDFVEDTAGTPDALNGSDDAQFAYLQTVVNF